MTQEENSQRSEALHLDFSLKAKQNAWSCFQETDSIARRPSSGRARITTVHEDRYIRLSASRERTVTARKLQNRLRLTTGTRVRDQTIRNRLHEDQQTLKRRAVRILLSRAQRANRLRFALQYLDWSINQWGTVLFTNECKVKFSYDDRRIRAWRRRSERFSAAYIHEVGRFGGPNVMIWGDKFTRQN